jgi:hypothetical protein
MLIPGVTNKVYFQVYDLSESQERLFVEFTGAQLLQNGEIVTEYIQHWHNGRSFFEFVPKEGQNTTLRVYRDFADGI